MVQAATTRFKKNEHHGQGWEIWSVFAWCVLNKLWCSASDFIYGWSIQSHMARPAVRARGLCLRARLAGRCLTAHAWSYFRHITQRKPVYSIYTHLLQPARKSHILFAFNLDDVSFWQMPVDGRPCFCPQLTNYIAFQRAPSTWWPRIAIV